VNFQPTVSTGFFGYYTFQKVTQSQWSYSGYSPYNAATNSTGCSYAADIAGLCNEDLGALYSLFNNPAQAGLNWFRYDTADKNNIFGVGFNHSSDRWYYNGTFQYTRTRSPMDYSDYRSVDGNVNQAVVAGIGVVNDSFAFPDMVWDRYQLNLSATYAFTSNLSVRVTYMFDKANIKDWHYDGLGYYSNVTGGRYYLDDGSQPYTANTIGAFLQYKM